MTDKPEAKLIFIAQKKERGKIKAIQFWAAKYLIYDDETMYYSSRHKLVGVRKWTPWSLPKKRGEIHFPLKKAAKSFEDEGWTVRWLRTRRVI